MDICFVKGYRGNAALRAGFNALTQKVYGFDFEAWYQAGCWQDNYIPYSAAIGDRVIANVSVNPMLFSVSGEKKHYVQLGTVMTDPEFRGRGLSRKLMEWVLSDWQDRCDMIYLFANDSVLDFYPRFGFVSRPEYQAEKQVSSDACGTSVRHMDLSDPEDFRLLRNAARNACPQSRLSMLHGENLVLFYCKYFSKWDIGKHVYHIPELDAVAVVAYSGETMELYDLFAPKEFSLDAVLPVLARPETRRVLLSFLPSDLSGWEISPYHAEDTTLFTLGEEGERFSRERLRFAELSHT